jgi:hypothetical protein
MEEGTEFYITSELSNFVLEANNSIKNIGAPIYVSEKVINRATQIWSYNNGYLENKLDKDLVLDIMGKNSASGAQLILWKKKNQKNQKWYYENGYIYSKLNNLVVDIKNGR